MNDGIIILSIILSLFFIGSFCIIMSMFEKENITYNKHKKEQIEPKIEDNSLVEDLILGEGLEIYDE